MLVKNTRSKCGDSGEVAILFGLEEEFQELFGIKPRDWNFQGGIEGLNEEIKMTEKLLNKTERKFIFYPVSVADMYVIEVE